jgi:glutamate-ammonia-ligase adenylyltransferase
MAGQEFAPDFFAEPQRAARQIRLLHEAFITSGSVYPLPQFSDTIEHLLTDAPDPDMALNNLVRFVEATFSKASLFNDLLQYPVVADLLGRIASYSQYLADILVRDPGLFRWLTGQDVLSRPVQKVELRSEALRIRDTFKKTARRLDALKRLYRREFLRIGSQDFLGLTDVAGATRQISDLADVIIDEVLALSAEELFSKSPTPSLYPFTVIGLGKLGGCELNYSSDIDLLFVYGDEAGKPVKRGKGLAVHEYFNRLGERLIHNLSRPTAEGHLYRVDIRLRPESGAGPIARSLRSVLVYYESRGELWERQMLIKARPVAGNLEFGQDVLHQLQPFVYPRTFFQHPAEYVARIKARIEASVGEEQNVKLMPGGIRDIEFVVQTLQLITGGSRPAVREPNTLEALLILEKEALLSAEECRILTEAYEFLRSLEHRLQVALNTQTHILPSDARTFDALARRMGLRDGEALRQKLRGHLQSVRSVYDRVLSVPEGQSEEGIISVIEGGLEEQALHSALSSYGFRDTRQALRNLRLLTSGSSLTGVQEFDSRTREAFRSVAPDLFREIAATPDPDVAFSGLTAILSSARMPVHYYSLLRTAGFRRLLLDVSRAGLRIARGLAADPLFLETLAADPGVLRSEPTMDVSGVRDLISFKQRHELRAGVRHLLGFTDFDGLTDDLTRLADAIVGKAVENEARAARLGREAIALFALGKYGTRELTFDADLDLFFVSPDKIASKNRIEDSAAALLRRLTAVSGVGRLYAADVRLRPEGKNAPLVVTLSAYTKYLRERASLWERQSLTRLRFVAGSRSLGEKLLRLVQKHLYGNPLPPTWVETIVGMRRKMESRSRFRGDVPIDIKVGAGGMADVEFIAQMIQLKFGSDSPAGHSRRTVDVLSGAPGAILPPDEVLELSESYRFYREVELYLRIALEESGSFVPDGQRLDTLARCLGRRQGEELKREIETIMKRTRQKFLSVSERLAG